MNVRVSIRISPFGVVTMEIGKSTEVTTLQETKREEPVRYHQQPFTAARTYEVNYPVSITTYEEPRSTG